MYLLWAGAEHAKDTEANSRHIESRGPVLVQNGQAYMAIAVNVRVHWNVGFDECNLLQITKVNRVNDRARKGSEEGKEVNNDSKRRDKATFMIHNKIKITAKSS